MSKQKRYIFLLFLFIFSSLTLFGQSGPGGIGNSDGSNGQPELLFWLNADSLNIPDTDPVDLWSDISGNGNDFEQLTSAEQPTFLSTGINSQPAIEFDGTDKSLVDDDGENLINGLNAFSFFAIIQSNTTGTDKGFFDGEDPDDSDDVFTIRYDNDGASGGGNNVIKAGISTSDDGEVNMESSSDIQKTTPQLLTLQWSSSEEISLYENGSQDVPTNGSGTATGSLVNSTKLIVGKSSKDGGASWDGKIAELFLYSNKLNSARRILVENYLSAKYNITISNDKFTGNDAAYVHDIAGIGIETDGDQTNTNSAGVYVDQNGNFEAGDYLMLAHDNATNDVASIRDGSEITNCGAEEAWNRDWYIEKTGNLDVKISFNIPEALDGGQYPKTASNYVLLYRSGTTGDYSQVKTGDGIEGSEEIYFNVSDASLNDGYYTLGTLNKTESPVEGDSGRTWYTLVSGDWSDPAIWTLDPSGALPNNPDNETPSSSNIDNVVILTGRTVDVNSDGLQNADLTVEGRLDLQETKNHSFSTINGTGRILLNSGNFPSGDATDFVTAGEGEGTVEFYGTGDTLSSPQTFYDVEVNLTNTDDTLTLESDFTINGDLRINQGVLNINNNTSTARLTLDVAENIAIASNGAMTVGQGDVFNLQSGYGNYHKSWHVVRVGGNFTNNGIVRLTNLSVPDYANPDPTAASLVFYGASNNQFNCNNTTDIYNLVVDKGTDRTYELEVYADDKSYFALFGQNDDEWDDTDPAHPENRKALWIANGSLRLKGNVYIPSLTEGTRDFTIGERAGLILDGSNVYVQNTALSGDDFSGLSHGQPNGINDGGSQQALYPYGKLQVDEGEYYLANGEAINFRDEAPGIIEVNGGRLEANQIAISSSASAGTFVFTVTGGEVHVTDEYGSDGGRALLNLDNSDMVFNMSGGAIYVTGANGHTPNAIHIGSSEQNHNVTGGTVYIQSGETSQMQSTAPFYNVEIINGSTLSLLEPLQALGSLTIQNNAALTANDYDVSIGNNFDFNDGATYNHGSNTTHFTGDQFTEVYVRNTTNAPGLTFNNLTINKEQRYDPSLYYSVEVHSGTGRDITDHPVEIQGNLTIERGEFDINEWEVDLKGNLAITDGNIIYNTTTPGYIVMNNATTAQTIQGDINKEPHFGNLEFNNGNGVSLLSDVDVNHVRLNDGIVDLDIYNLDISGDLTTTDTYGNSLMFSGAGNASDGGLTQPIDLADGSIGTEYIFPIGTGSSYNPARINQEENVSDSGKITITPVNKYHPSASDPSKTIEYYWVVDTTGFSTLNYDDLRYTFTFSGAFPGGVKRGVNLWPENYEWEDNGNVENEPDLEFPASAHLRSDFTLGNAGDFKKPEIFYSRIPSSDYNIGGMPQWSDGDTWSTDSLTGPAAGDWPKDGDIAIIGYGGADPGDGGGNRHHVAYRNTDNYDLAKVIIDASEEAGVWSSRLFIEEGSTIDMGVVDGDGTLEIRLDPASPSTINGDFGDFSSNYAEGSRVLYHAEGGTSIELPDLFNQLPNVRLEGGGTRTFYFPREVTVLGELRVDYNATLRLEHDITVNGDFRLGNYREGILQFPDDVAHTMTVNSDFRLTSDGDSEVSIDNSTTNGLEHKLRVAGNIELDQGNRFDLFTDNSGGNNVILELFGGNDAEMSNLDDMPVEIYRLEMNKQSGTDFRIYRDPGDPSVSMSNFSINGPTNGTPKALELIGGRLMLQDGGINVTLTSGGSDFYIPSQTTLHAKHGATLRTSGSNTGLLLDGAIEASYASNWLINQGTNNYIEYTASGNAQIDIYQADFYVGSQIRRNTVTEGGILSFIQHHANSNVVLGTNADQGGATSRGIFELVNSGSYFEQVDGATISIANHVNNPTAPAFYINLDASEVSLGEGSSIVFGSNETVSNQNFILFSNQPLKNVEVNNASSQDPKVTLQTVTLTADTLTISNGTAFDANGLDLTLYGDLYSNGTFTSNQNTTYFSGTVAQQITGNPQFYNLTKNSSNTLTLNSDITVNNELRLESGSLSDGGNTLNAKGDVWMNITHNYGGTGEGILFNGNVQQNLQGTGTFGRLSVDNAYGIYVPEGNTISIDNDLQMKRGVLDIGKNLLVLNEGATITETNAFSEQNMVQTNISFTDAGIKKSFPEITSTTTFTYPIGSAGKYTPVELTIDQKDAGGSVRIKAANEMHPGIIEDEENPDPEITDADNVLQYHWVVDAQSISGFSADMFMEYDDEDVSVTSPYDITDYITARLLSNSKEWNKYDNASFDQNNNRMNFNFSNVDQAGISGDYTAGVDGLNFNGAIPDSVPIYHSAQNGDWFDNATWEEDIPGGPKGAIAIVQDSVYLSSNYLVGYKTVIEDTGVVDVGTTFGHRIGTVEGTGKLRLERGNLPAGVYEQFFSPDGGTIEFAGPDSYDVLSEITNVNNLLFSGTGERRLPNLDFEVYGLVTIDGDDTNLKIINEHDRTITIDSNIVFTQGSFDAGAGTSKIIMNGTSNQTITGDFTGTNNFHHLEINNTAGVKLNGPLDMDGDLTFTNGVLTTTPANILTMTNQLATVSGNSESQYIDGPMAKNLQSGVSFTFPVGDNSRYGKPVITNTTVSGYWEAQYYDENPDNHATLDTNQYESTLSRVSGNEYWRINGPASGTAQNQIRWDEYSILPAETDDRPNNLKMVEWITANTRWEIVDPATVVDNGINDGTITSDNKLNLDGNHYFTLGTTESDPLPTAGFLSSDTAICDGSTVTLRVEVTGKADFEIDVDDGSSISTYPGSSSPITFDVTPGATTTYTITEVTEDTDGSDGGPTSSTTTIFGDPVTITVNPLPLNYTLSGGANICSNDSTELQLDGSESGIDYEVYRDDGSIQLIDVISGTGNPLSLGYYQTAGDYTVTAVNPTTGCTRDMNGADGFETISVTQAPDPEPTAAIGSVCFDNGATVDTLDANDVEGVGDSFTWSPDSSLTLNTKGDTAYYQPTWNPNSVSVERWFKVTVTEPIEGCQAVDSVNVELYRKPETGNQYYVPNEFDQD